MWVAGATNYVHVFDATVMPPTQVTSIKGNRVPKWITFSLDGRYRYCGPGEVIDTQTHKIVATYIAIRANDIHGIWQSRCCWHSSNKYANAFTHRSNRTCDKYADQRARDTDAAGLCTHPNGYSGVAAAVQAISTLGYSLSYQERTPAQRMMIVAGV